MTGWINITTRADSSATVPAANAIRGTEDLSTISLSKWRVGLDPFCESTGEEDEIDEDLIENLLQSLLGIFERGEKRDGSSCLRKSEVIRRDSVRGDGERLSLAAAILPS